MNQIVPAFQKINETPGSCHLPEFIGIDTGPFAAWCVEALLQRTGKTCKKEAPLWLALKRNESLPQEGYCLQISKEGLLVEASTETGVVWALTTVANLLDKDTLPCCSIEDAPNYPHRGLHLDCARHFFPASEVKKVIEEISLAKMNVLHWHLSDDQGWRIESKRFPRLHQISKEYFLQAEILEMVEYARIRGVEIVPEIDLPGHTGGILAAYPEHSCSGKFVKLVTSGGIYPIILCAGKEETFTFLEQLLDEIVPLFSGPRFHIGGDEAPKTEWKKCPHCTTRMKALGLAGYEELQGYFSQRINQILKRHGKQAICWNETLLASNHPADIQVQYWTLQHRQAMETFVEQGGQWIYSDMFELYFDYPYSMTSQKKVYSIIPHLGKTEVASSKGLLGMEACLWAEHITDGERLEQLLFPRIYALAELCWSGASSYKDFCARLSNMQKMSLHQGICYTPQHWWEPKGRARRKEAIGFFTAINKGMSTEVRKETVKSAAPNREFAQSFIKKFFRPLDVPFLLKAMLKK